jgi:CheY-like chemotaxis protein
MRKSVTVFVVDDEPMIRNTVAAILSHEGYEAVPFADGTTALSAAAVRSPDLLITDVMMPEMDGVELAIHFRNLYPECKVLVFSGHASTLDLLADARLRGYDLELLAKPIHPVELLEKLQAVSM